MIAEIPLNETERIDDLKSYNILDTLPEQSYDDITALASQICNTPIAVISLIDTDRNWFKSEIGLGTNEVHRNDAFCSHAILEDGILIVPDATKDNRFNDNVFVLNDPKIRFYAGAPLITPHGNKLGTICVLDSTPRELSYSQIHALESLSRQVIIQLELRKNINELEKNKEEKERLLISEQKAHRKAEHESKKLASLFLNAPALISMLEPSDNEYIYRMANPEYEKLIGTNLIGKSVREVIPYAIGETFLSDLDNVFKTGKPFIGNEVYFVKDGEPITNYFNAIYQPIFNVDNKIDSIAVFAFDISNQVLSRNEIEKLYKELEKSNEYLNNFAYVASHDLQEPLRMISSYTQLLAKRYKDKLDDNANEFIGFITDGTKRMKALIESILEHSKIQKRLENCQQVDLNEVMEIVKSNLSILIQENNVKITYDNMPMIEVEANHMIQLFQNLISNSIKYKREEPPNINISATESNGRYLISVTDNGIGIESENFEKIFLIFQRLHSRSEYEGTGIGLANCKKIAELYNGEIWVESIIGQGSTFFISLLITNT